MHSSSDVKKQCPICQKPAGLKCSRCKLVYYCVKEHQVQDWKQHKTTCCKPPPPALPSPPESQDQPRGMPLPAPAPAPAPIRFQPVIPLPPPPVDQYSNLGLGFYSRLSKHDAYVRIIDAYRLRVEDDYKTRGFAHGLYIQNTVTPLKDFRTFLGLASRNRALPEWWEDTSDVPALLDVALTDDWANIKYPVEVPDVVDRYGGLEELMVLRELAAQVYDTR